MTYMSPNTMFFLSSSNLIFFIKIDNVKLTTHFFWKHYLLLLSGISGEGFFIFSPSHLVILQVHSSLHKFVLLVLRVVF